MDFRSITEEDLKLFIKRTIKEENLSKKGYNGLRVVLRGTFMYAKEHGYTDISISAFLGDLNLSKKCFRKVVKKKEELVFTADEVKMLEDYIYSIEYSPEDLGILLAFQTGVRVGELAALQWSDLSGEVLHVWKTEVTYKDDEPVSSGSSPIRSSRAPRKPFFMRASEVPFIDSFFKIAYNCRRS